MKKLLHLLLLPPLLAIAQPTPPGGAPPASQAEVNAGLISNKYVSPKTLNDWPGGGGGGTPGGSPGDWQINNGGTFGGVTPALGWNDVFVTPNSDNLRGWLIDETGTGVAVFNTSPTVASPTLTGTTTVDTMAATTLSATSFTFNSVSVTGPTGTGNMVLATAPTINSAILSGTSSPSSDDTYGGRVITGLNNSGGVTQWDAVYLNGSSQWVLADANGTNTYPARGLATATATTGNATTVVTIGIVRNDAWAWTPGGNIYLSGTAGSLTQTAPSTPGDKVQVVGFALTADVAYFDFDSTYVTVQ